MKNIAEFSQEQARLVDLEELNIIESELDQNISHLPEIIAGICQTKAAFLSFIDQQYQWIKASYGVKLGKFPKAGAICATTILEDGLFEVADCLNDEKFKHFSFVNQDPSIVFYAGFPIKSINGYNLGTLCVVDEKSRTLNPFQKKSLEFLAKQVSQLLCLRLLVFGQNQEGNLKTLIQQIIAHNHQISGNLTSLMLSLDINQKKIPTQFYESAMGTMDKIGEGLKEIKSLTKVYDVVTKVFTKSDIDHPGNKITSNISEAGPEHLSVLLVEDDEQQRDFLADVIEEKANEKVKVTVAEDGEKAIELVKVRKFDMIITDFSLPKVDGTEFIKFCRSNEKNKNTPIIFTSGGLSLVDTKALQEQTTKLAIIEKPFKFEQLIELMEAQFRHR